MEEHVLSACVTAGFWSCLSPTSLPPCELALHWQFQPPLQHAQPNKDVHTHARTALPVHTATPHLHGWRLVSPEALSLVHSAGSSFVLLLFFFFRTEHMSHVCCTGNSTPWNHEPNGPVSLTCSAHSSYQGSVLLKLPLLFSCCTLWPTVCKERHHKPGGIRWLTLPAMNRGSVGNAMHQCLEFQPPHHHLQLDCEENMLLLNCAFQLTVLSGVRAFALEVHAVHKK